MPDSISALPEPNLFDGTAQTDTRGRILEATYRRLATEGFTNLSIREIAKDAGVNHALINYHFRTKEQLVIQVLDAANERLLARQRSMYESELGYAAKWRRAREFYKTDLASGFVRVQAELWAASFSNAELRERFVPRILAWKQVVRENVAEALQELKSCGVELPPPFSAEVLASWICEYWFGMEFADLLGMPGERKIHDVALDAVELLLADLDARVMRLTKAGSGRKSTRRRGAAK